MNTTPFKQTTVTILLVDPPVPVNPFAFDRSAYISMPHILMAFVSQSARLFDESLRQVFKVRLRYGAAGQNFWPKDTQTSQWI
jgi:hypothetical protein